MTFPTPARMAVSAAARVVTPRPAAAGLLDRGPLTTANPSPAIVDVMTIDVLWVNLAPMTRNDAGTVPDVASASSRIAPATSPGVVTVVTASGTVAQRVITLK